MSKNKLNLILGYKGCYMKANHETNSVNDKSWVLLS